MNGSASSVATATTGFRAAAGTGVGAATAGSGALTSAGSSATSSRRRDATATGFGACVGLLVPVVARRFAITLVWV